jgi:predicted DNA-binding antitoxin AbrB/MazE fold protein
MERYDRGVQQEMHRRADRRLDIFFACGEHRELCWDKREKRMAQVIEAIYAHGVLTPRNELALRESQRVRLIVEPIDDDTDHADRSAALRRLREGIARMQFFSREPLPSRDQLHGRP